MSVNFLMSESVHLQDTFAIYRFALDPSVS